MKYIRYASINKDSKDIPDGEIFTVFENNMWAFAIRINNEYSLSSWKEDGVSIDEIKKSMKQVLYAKENGWSRTDEEQFDDMWEKKRLFKCLYCGSETLEVEGPCACRGREKSATLSDFILPSDW